MRPTLLALRLGESVLHLPSYGLAVTLGFALAITLAARQAPRAGIERTAVLDLGFWLIVAGIGGSRLLYVLLDAGDYARLCAGGDRARAMSVVLHDCFAPLRLWDGGLVFYGGAIAAAVVVFLFARRHGWRYAVLGDLLAPSLVIGHAVGRLGCFLAGCCYGKACLTAGAPCVSFPPDSVAHEQLMAWGLGGGSHAFTPPLHPTQLYESAGLIALYFVLLLVRRRQRFHGELVLVYAAAYALLRFAIETFRGDAARRFVVELATPSLARALHLPGREPLFLSTSQTVSLVLLIAAVAIFARQRRRYSAAAGIDRRAAARP